MGKTHKKNSKNKPSTCPKVEGLWPFLTHWILFTLLTSFLPIGLAMLFDRIVGYHPFFKDYAPDVLLMIASILFASIWNTQQNDTFLTKQARDLMVTLQWIFALACIVTYFALYGNLSILNFLNVSITIPKIIFFVLLGILAGDILWDTCLQRNEYINKKTPK